MDRASRGGGDLFGWNAIAWRTLIRPTDTHDVCPIETQREEVRPLGRGIGVAVKERDDLAATALQALVSRGGQAGVRYRDEAGACVLPDDGGGLVGRAVVDHDDLQVRIVEGAGVTQAFVDRGFRVVGANDDAHRRPFGPEVLDGLAIPSLGDIERHPW